MNTKPALAKRPRLHNRVAAIMIHTSRYAFNGPSRLARDTGLSVSAVSRFMHGRVRPSPMTLLLVMSALEAQLGFRLRLDEVISLTGEYPTRNICELLNCKGCLPDKAYHPDNERRDWWKTHRGGDWTGDVAEVGDEKLIDIEEVTE